MPKIARRTRPVGTLCNLQRRLWLVVELCTRVIENEDQPLEERCRVGHLLVQAAGAYARVSEVADLERRLVALESHVNGGAKR